MISDVYRPIDDPLGRHGHHTQAPFTPDDRANGDLLAYHIGTLFEDYDDVLKLWEWWHKRRTSREEWTRVARALRIHGLRIVNSKERTAELDAPQG